MINASKLRGKLAEANMTQKDLATAMGISTNTLSRKISGKRDVTVGEVKKICDLLGIFDDSEKINIFLQ